MRREQRGGWGGPGVIVGRGAAAVSSRRLFSGTGVIYLFICWLKQRAERRNVQSRSLTVDAKKRRKKNERGEVFPVFYESGPMLLTAGMSRIIASHYSFVNPRFVSFFGLISSPEKR